ncbi:hypothetical protein KVR01_013758 [Diaporthe batatas]|uniref:uncharacterized protein n=1 Tax=Diaporthe batatas TaxID=748121 RepID=UPI001D0416FD|nr:uncharacterized protein KVR01_013758 [Diaporthe batatas]KAG8156417.1 hypothetical protein KVR01_013758 [Diaporthe batatas]
MYGKIGDSLPQLLHTERLFLQDTAVRRVLGLVYKDIFEFHRLAMKYFKQPTTWKPYKTRFDPLIANIHDHAILVQNQATLAQIDEFRRDRQADGQQHDAHRLRVMYTWLRSPEHASSQARNAENDQYHYARARRDCPGSGSWLLGKQAFVEWMDPAFPAIPPLLWINGCPDFLRSRASEALTPSADTLLLRCHQDVLSPFFYEKFSKSSEAVLSKVQDIEELLRVSLLNCAKVYIVLDGIDDQDDGIARKDFDGITTLKIQPADVEDDIKKYSLHEAGQIQSMFELSDDMRADMAAKMIRAAGGMWFLSTICFHHA